MIFEEMKIARCVEYEAMSEEPLMLGQEASIEMPGGKIKDLPPPPKIQAEVSKSQYRRAFEYSQMVSLKGLMEVGCFELVDRGWKIVNSKWVHTYKGDEFGNLIKTKSRLVSKSRM